MSFFLVIAWKIPLPMVPNLTFYEFCLRRPLFWANSTRLYIFIVLYLFAICHKNVITYIQV